ncbi:30S ribosomal protein S28e [Candidatus Micrarchaeota archaeon]|nr:30S ribosomal protein S28e [Candidatus Micrarchaeota archaeon]
MAREVKPKGRDEQKQKKDERQSAPIQAQGFLVEVVEILGRTGVFGEVIQVMCKVLDGRDKGRAIRRNIKGPVKKGDFLMLLETEREAKPLKSKTKKDKPGERPPAGGRGRRL